MVKLMVLVKLPMTNDIKAPLVSNTDIDTEPELESRRFVAIRTVNVKQKKVKSASIRWPSTNPRFMLNARSILKDR